MTSAMYSAIGGLRTHMSNLGVIGNNIANVNTQAYKAQRMTFQESMYTTSTAGSDGSVNSGGNNPSQIGYGATIGSIDLNMSPSTYSPTGYGLDCMLDGEGFFIVGDKKTGLNVESAADLATFDLTRMGDFRVDAQGYICDRRGNCLYGFAMVQNPDYNPELGESEDNPKTIVSTELVPLRLPLSAARPTGKYEGAWNEGDPVFNVLGSIRGTTPGDTNNNARSNFSVGALLNVVYERARQVIAGGNADGLTDGSGTLVIAQNAGGAGGAAGVNSFTSEAERKKLEDIGLLPDSDNFSVSLRVVNGSIVGVEDLQLPTGFAQPNASAMGAAGVGTGTGGGAGTGGAASVPYGTSYQPIPNAEDTCVELTGMSVSKEGAIMGTTQSGEIITIGYIAVVNASANDGVTHTDGYYYKAMEGAGSLRVSCLGGVLDGKYLNNKHVSDVGGDDSNYALTNPPTSDAILGGGVSKIRNGGLEASSTDIATEFANMILTQRGYQANTRIITVTDSMLEELVNMKR